MLFILLWSLFCVMLLALPFVSLYLINVPEWLFLLVNICFIILFFFIAIKRKKIQSKIIFGAATFLCTAASILSCFCNPYRNSLVYKINADYSSNPGDMKLSGKEALKDLSCAIYIVKTRHPAAYHGLSDEILQKYEEEKKSLSEMEQITIYDLNHRIESILSHLHDGHTSVQISRNPYIMKDYRKLKRNGWNLTQVNGISKEDLLKKYADYYSYETDSWQWVLLENDLMTTDGLKYLGITPENGVNYIFQKNKDTLNKSYVISDFLSYEEYLAYYEEQSEEDYYYEIDTKRSLAVLHLKTCNDDKEYRTLLKKMFQEVKEKKLQNVAVDLRGNTGGDSGVANEFIRYLNQDTYQDGGMKWRLGWFMRNYPSETIENEKIKDLTFHGNVFLLTDSDTFSSAMMFAQIIKDNHLGTLIGEAPGNDPNGYGEIAYFSLPHSHLILSVSTKQFLRINQKTDDFLVEPDIKCSSNDAMKCLYENCQ